MDNRTRICGMSKEFTNARFIFRCIGSSVAGVGISWNFVLVILFLTRKNREVNLAALACMDCLLCLCYVLLFGVEAVAFHLNLEILYDALFHYLLAGFVLSRAVQMSIPALLVLTSVQRWASLTNRKLGAWRILESSTGRGVICLLLIIVCSAVRLPMCWALKVHHYKNCSHYFRSKELWPGALYYTSWYHNYEFSLTCAQVFGSFVVLLLLNTAVLLQLRSHRRKNQRILEQLMLSCGKQRRVALAGCQLAEKISQSVHQEIRNAAAHEQNAFYSTLIIVTTYLICNLFHVVLTVFERWGTTLLRNQHGWIDMYIYASDFISFLFMFCSVIRLIIYYNFNPMVRQQLKPILCYWSNQKLSKREMILNNFQKSLEFEAETFEPTDDFLLPLRKRAFALSSNVNSIGD